MITSMILSGGPLAQSYDFMSPSSKIQLEEGFSDQISQRGSSMLGRDPYIDMVTTLPLTAVGTTEADAWNAYNTFCTFAQRIAAFPLSPDRNPIIFGYKTVSAATLMYTLCLGTPDGNPRTPIVSQPSGTMLADAAGMYRIRGFKISFRRKGRFITQASTDLAAVTAGTTNSPLNGRDAYGIFPADFDTDSPLDASLILNSNVSQILTKPNEAHWLISNPHSFGVNESDSPGIYQSFIVIPGNTFIPADGTIITTTDTIANTYPFSGVGANLLKFQAIDNVARSATATSSGWPSKFLVLATIRPDLIAGATSIMQISMQDKIPINTTKGKVISLSGDGRTRIVNCGVFSVPDTWVNNAGSVPKMTITHQNTSSALSRVWVDELIIVNLEVANLAYIKFGPMRAFNQARFQWDLEQRYLSATMPQIVGGDQLPGTYPNPAWGNTHMSVKARRVRSLFLGVGSDGGGAGVGQWRWLQTNTHTVTYKAYKAGLSPLGS